MAIQQLEIRGYRSFREAAWRPGKLNLLVGANGGGKSNLLRILELISNASKGKLCESIYEAGGMVPLVWDHQAPGFGWKLRIDPVDAGRDPVQDALTLECELKHLPNTSSYQIAMDSLGNWSKYEQGLESSPFYVYTPDARRALVYDQQVHGFSSIEAKRTLESWRIYHDVHVERGSAMRSPTTTQYAKLVAPDGSNLVSVLPTLYTSNREFKRQVNEGMRAGFGDQFEELVFQPAAA
jgi:predicted ATPase